MCGTTYDPSTHPGCAQCPVHRGCELTCCPACGYSTVDPSRSTLVGWVVSNWPWRHRGRRRPAGRRSTLADLHPGSEAVVAGYRAMAPARRRRLEALGLGVGERVIIRQQSPATIVRVDRSELAIERELASQIAVLPGGPHRPSHRGRYGRSRRNRRPD